MGIRCLLYRVFCLQASFVQQCLRVLSKQAATRVFCLQALFVQQCLSVLS